ncbi:FeS assembly SUF system protein SufT [Piscirickettsia salmonis]|uniref:FeS assembly SUF system protein SufT n=1 Tax=Piscirickettsia salmonis TaxID=1238 RepID=A0A9Q5VF14_PISSA|nr:putative Fe-S cluster assembly protein SufT [Piscirickettsia salmonis]ALA24910.1 FeS assembly SUF system protein SufT [Piscirickettsia salmonis]APS49839.1 FeS assembly SUF system protein SufT [Piscirickettsia salmonis]APS53025.1 FeS assembly SUF system protein SufT [Piscirickettsia salmonis]APS56154.1 FeS assembly SUF system protein SufT [Piscirickettsia salmonis]ERL63065.1 hypothetical protein K661_00567 [Piscirickettsia salmonis LF-89 = ATCC VR-1361]
MNHRYEVVMVSRECEGHLIPAGDNIVLQPGTEAIIAQALGGSYTLNVNGNLIRLDGKDADAIGKEPILPIVDDGRQWTQEEIEEHTWNQLRLCYDPEIPVNIVDLGLVYECQIIPAEKGTFFVQIKMTLTAAGCGMGPVLMADAETKVRQIPKVVEVNVKLVFDPPWSREMMSEAAQLELGVF